MKNLQAVYVHLLAWGICCCHAVAASPESMSPDRYDVTWHSPSEDASGSMPLGNGDIGLNAWIDPADQLVFTISKTDSWGDNGRLLKVGRVRVRFDPPFPTAEFRQTLRLRDATMEVVSGEGTDAATLRLWVDANHPVIHVTVTGNTPRTAIASIELWRTEQYELPSIEVSDVNLDRSKPKGIHAPTIVDPDQVIEQLSGRVGWYHHNDKSVGPAEHAETQGMTGYERPDPLLHRTFGAVITAEDGRRLDDMFMAYLGLADDARKNIVARARNHHSGSRFPAFWGPNYDWIPDQDHGSVLMKTLQAIVHQPDPYSDKIHLLPVWPQDWNVRFKLHASNHTTVECEYRDGKIASLKITPQTRREDLVMMEPSP